MRIMNVEWNNFGPFFGQHEFKLADRGLLLVMGENLDEPRMDSNGSGKSTVFDALDWCLWGENSRGDHAEAMFNEEAYLVRGAKCWVRVNIETDEGALIVITRSRSKSKYELEVTADSVPMGKLDTKESQKVIEQLLGMDREVFHAAVLFGQTDMVHYADATDGKRMEILTKILQLDDIDRYQERAKGKARSAETRKATLQADLSGVNGQLQATRPEDLDEQIQQWAQENQEAQARLQEQLAAKAAEHQAAQAQVTDPGALQAQKASLDQELTAPAPVESPEVEQACQVAENAQQEAAVGAQECVRLENQLIHMQNQSEGVCSQCGQPVTAQHLQNEVQRAREALQAASDRQSVLRTQVEGAEAARKAAKETFYQSYAAWQAARDQKVQESAKIDADLRILAGHQARVDTLAREMGAIQADIARRQAAVNPWVERRTQVENERYELERKQGQIQYELETLQAEAAYLNFWVQALGPRGLKSYILDSRLQELSDAANEWLSWLTGGTIWVRFEAQKQTRGKKLVNAPDVRVFRWNPDGTTTERSYRSWSGGEKQRISFCIDFGLSRLVARRAAKTYDLLILDEVFKHLDRSGKEAVMEMLQALAHEKSSLIVVEHDTEFQGQFDRRALVRKQNRRSQLLEIDHGKATQKEEEEGVPEHLPANPDSKRVIARVPVRRPVS